MKLSQGLSYLGYLGTVTTLEAPPGHRQRSESWLEVPAWGCTEMSTASSDLGIGGVMLWSPLVLKLPPLVRAVSLQMVCFSLIRGLGVGLSFSGPVKCPSPFS